jgi:hypothetical protein
MGFKIIKGTYHIVGYSPDGDSLRFKARNEDNWRLLGGPRAALNAKRHAQLRLEAIDTLETHSQHPPNHQPLDLATRAMDFLLNSLGIDEVVFDALRTRVTSANDGVDGYILSREVEKFGRPIAFVFSGDPAEEDGSDVFLDTARLEKSVNFQSLAGGFAYPTYYKGLFADLRNSLTAVVRRARQAKAEIWAEDVTNTGFAVTGLDSIADEHVCLPKLFRRLSEFLQAGGPVSGFKEFLEAKNEEVLIIDTAHPTHFDNVVEVSGNVVRMTQPPENLLFSG